MPIHDQSYRRYRGQKADVRSAWTVIALNGINGLLRQRMFLGVLLGAWIPFLIRAVQLYLAAAYPQATMLAANSAMFRAFLEQQGFWVFVMTVYVGSGLIANDRRANALQIYLSKPLTRAEYIGGKVSVLIVFLLLVTLVPSLLLLLLQAVFAGSFTFVRENIYLVPAITVASLLEVLLASFVMLALSSLSKSSRYVAILYTGIMIFTNAIFGVLRLATGSTGVSWISFTASMEQVIDAIFRQPLRYDTPIGVSLLVVVGLIALSISVLERRVRGVEVVA